MSKFLFSLLLLTGSNVLAASDETARFACSLGDNQELVVVEKTVGKGLAVELQLDNTIDDGLPQTLWEFSSVQVVEYGNTYIVLGDSGKSGYALIRIERNVNRKGGKTYSGLLDVNLFSPDVPDVLTNGPLTTTCRKRLDAEIK